MNNNSYKKKNIVVCIKRYFNNDISKLKNAEPKVSLSVISVK